MKKLLFIGDEIWTNGAPNGPARSGFVMLSVHFNVGKAFTNERTGGAGVLLFIRMHHVSYFHNLPNYY